MFQGCLNPQRVYNSSLGDYLTVSCGHCEYCRDARRKSWAERLEHEFKCAEYVVFCTLTYSNYHLPRVYYNEKGIVTNFQVSSVFNYYNRHTKSYQIKKKRKNLKCFNGLNVLTLDPEIDKWLRPPHWVRARKNNVLTYDDTNSFAVCYRPDITKYFKRVRSNIERRYPRCETLPEFRYFAVSEYGPDTYRPHYHVLLFFDKRPDDEHALLHLLFKSWGKSSVSEIGSQFEVVRNKAASAKYISKYVSKDVTLPLILLSPEFSTFSSKSIAPPLGSQSFAVSDIPSILDKGTLLYDGEYYDKEKGSYVSYKCSFPSCAWHRVFPKLLGRRLLSNVQMYSVFERIFRYKDCPERLPNLVKEFPKKYPIGFYSELLTDEAIDDYIARYNGFDDPLDFPALFQYHLSVSANIENVGTPLLKNRATYSRFFDRLINTDLDFFLFGIPQNLTFCRKILKHANQHAFLSSPFLYCQNYLRYETIHFSDTLRYCHEHYVDCPNPFEFASIYEDFYLKLYPCIYDYQPDTVTRLDSVLLNFGLSLSSFYDSDGQKTKFDFNTPRKVEQFRLLCKESNRKVNSQYQSAKYNDL